MRISLKRIIIHMMTGLLCFLKNRITTPTNRTPIVFYEFIGVFIDQKINQTEWQFNFTHKIAIVLTTNNIQLMITAQSTQRLWRLRSADMRWVIIIGQNHIGFLVEWITKPSGAVRGCLNE